MGLPPAGHQSQRTPSPGPLKLAIGSHSSSAHKVGDGKENSAGNSGVPTPIEHSVNTQTNERIELEHPMDPIPMNMEIEFSDPVVDPRVMALRTAATKLYAKYLVTYAPNEVNISAGLRRNFDMHDASHWNLDCLALVHVFDEVTD